MSLSFWNQRRRNSAAMIRMQEEAKAKEEAEKLKSEEAEEKPQTKRGRKNADEGTDRKS